MRILAKSKAFLQRLISMPAVRRGRKGMDSVVRTIRGRPRRPAEGANLLPLLIQVLAAFSKAGAGEVLEQEIDSALGFLRYDYPEAVYSELRKLFRMALNEPQNLSAMAKRLASELTTERKVMLGVQLYDLIARAGMDRKQVADFYAFMAELGTAAQAIDIVYQLNTSGEGDKSVYQAGQSPLETLVIGAGPECDVMVKEFSATDRLVAFRFQELILLKNQSSRGIVVRGRPLLPGAFSRVYLGQRIILGEQVLTYQDLVYYFNAKKHVGTSIVYLTLDGNDEVEIEKARSRDSALEVKFDLKVQVRALRDVDAMLNGTALRAGTRIDASLEDRIIFHTDAELQIMDIRRRARALGGRFQLKSYKSVYLVSNDPGLLDQDDILLSPGTSGDVLLKILCDYERRVGRLEVLASDRPVYVNGVAVKTGADLRDGEVVRINTGQQLRCDFSNRIIEEERNVISHLEIRDISLRFRKHETALDGLSLTLSRGELVCVMGASGCGKTTLMRVLAGQVAPQRGGVLLNGQSLYGDLEHLKRFIAYIPQDDAFDDHLTVEENVRLAAAIRAPHLSPRDRARRVESRLTELGLIERRDAIVGPPTKKRLSGGERKRLNVGLDMISPADVFLFDEPTSGLSSKDSEHVIEILRSLGHNKIVLVTIHQPNSKLFQMFSKAILLDKGGKLVFFGTPQEMLQYFSKAELDQHLGSELGGCPACGTTRPEFIFDVLESPLRDLSGEVIFEENFHGQLVPARRFSPDFWRDRYESHRLVQEMKQVNVRKQQAPATIVDAPAMRFHERIRWRDEWTQFRAVFVRAFISKLRNGWNLILTLLIPPFLAAVVGWALYFTDDESGNYDFASAFHIPTYIFIALLVSLFLALMNSFDDIIRDRVILHRERNLDVRLPYYIFSKFLTLCLFSAVQCALFTAVGNSILEIKGMFYPYFACMLLTAVNGISLGMVISSIVQDSKTAALFVPLVLIPQLIFGGALIKYDEMNQDPDLIYSFQRWFSTQPGVSKGPREDDQLTVPFISRFVATHYSYEALIVAQAKLNPLSIRQDALQDQMDKLVANKRRNEAEEERLEHLKETLALLSGLESATVREIEKRLSRVDAIIAGQPLRDPDQLRSRTSGLTAERLYSNQKVNDLVNKAETEQNDYRRQRRINVFFGPLKHYQIAGWHFSLSVYARNTLVLGVVSLVLLAVLRLILRHQLRTGAKP